MIRNQILIKLTNKRDKCLTAGKSWGCGAHYRPEERCSAFSRTDEGDRSACSFQLLADIIRVQLQEGVVIVKKGNKQYICGNV